MVTILKISSTVIGSSLVPLTSLLIEFTGFADPVVHLSGLTGSPSVKQTWPYIAMCLVFLGTGSARV